MECKSHWTYLGSSSFHRALCSLPGSSAIMSLLAAPMLSANTRRHIEANGRGPLVPLLLRAGGNEMEPARTRSQCLPCWYGAEREAWVARNEAAARVDVAPRTWGEDEAGSAWTDDSGEDMLLCL